MTTIEQAKAAASIVREYPAALETVLAFVDEQQLPPPPPPPFISPLSGKAWITNQPFYVLPSERKISVPIDLASPLNRPILSPFVTKDGTFKEWDGFYRKQGNLFWDSGVQRVYVDLELKKQIPAGAEFYLSISGSKNDPSVPGIQIPIRGAPADMVARPDPQPVMVPARAAGRKSDGKRLILDSNFLEPVNPIGGPGQWRSRFEHHRYQAGNREWAPYCDASTDPGTTPHPIIDGVRRVRAERVPTKDGVANFDFSASMMSTEKRWAGTYGYFEFTGSFPDAKCHTPALWFTAADNRWTTDFDELDWLEGFWYPDGRKDYTTTAHWKNPDGSHGHEAVAMPFPSPFSEHVHGLEWTPDTLIWYLDGVETHRRPNLTFHQVMFFIVNLAVWVPGSPPIPADLVYPKDIVAKSFRIWQP